jgi:hypothetical protein
LIDVEVAGVQRFALHRHTEIAQLSQRGVEATPNGLVGRRRQQHQHAEQDQRESRQREVDGEPEHRRSFAIVPAAPGEGVEKKESAGQPIPTHTHRRV